MKVKGLVAVGRGWEQTSRLGSSAPAVLLLLLALLQWLALWGQRKVQPFVPCIVQYLQNKAHDARGDELCVSALPQRRSTQMTQG